MSFIRVKVILIVAILSPALGSVIKEVNRPRASDTVCYGDLGCFTTASPWTSNVRPIPQLPEDPAIINTRFLLNTRENPDEAITLVRDDALGLYDSPYDSTKKTVFIIHGWTHDSNHPWVATSVTEILKNEDVNVIRVDWGPGAGYPYLRALTNIQVVGAEMSQFILFLASKTVLDYANIHLIGHDLGAHAASYVGRRLYGIGRITGLDPSSIYFEDGDTATRLDPTDALLVDIVHTDASYQISLFKDHIGLGFKSQLGSIDIFVNNGQAQPGCEDLIGDLVNNADDLVTMTKLEGPIDRYVCSHMRAVDYFVEAINSQCPFSAYSCSSWDSFLQGTCYSTCRSQQGCTALGYNAGKYPARGVFHLDTQSIGPYCNTVLRLELDISPDQVQTKGKLHYILVGDVGQTKETNFYDGPIGSGFILDEYVSVAGSNAYRIGHVEKVRLKYNKDSFQENEVIVQRVVVQQANYTINCVDNKFKGAILPDGQLVDLLPA